MTWSRRERYIVIGTILAVGGLALDRFALEPLMTAREVADARKSALLANLSRARAILTESRTLAPKWRDMGRTMQSDPAGAESQALHALADWSEQCGVKLALLKPDRMSDKSVLPQISLQASGTGTMDSIARLIWRVQTAKIPLRITEVQVTARKEGTDDLSVALRLSTVYMPGGARPATPATAASRPAGAGT